MEHNERWIKSGLLGVGIDAHYDIDAKTDHSVGPTIATVYVNHVSEKARRTASERADLICQAPELKQRVEAAEAALQAVMTRTALLEEALGPNARVLNKRRDDQIKQLTAERDAALARAAALEQERDTFSAENDAIHRAVNEMCGTDTSTIEAVQTIIDRISDQFEINTTLLIEKLNSEAERDEARRQLAEAQEKIAELEATQRAPRVPAWGDEGSLGIKDEQP